MTDAVWVGLKTPAETKREEAARFLRARSDPVFAKMVRVRQLGPEQVENQKRIRLQVEVSLFFQLAVWIR